MRTRKTTSQDLSSLQTERFLHPQLTVTQIYKHVYEKNNIQIGWSSAVSPVFTHLSRKNSAAIVGVALGDEGKGRLVDNKIESFLKDPKCKKVVVIRFQGGNNAGHTVEKGKIKLALHLVPSGVLHKKAVNVIDRGVVVHAEDLQTEIVYVEKHTEAITQNLLLSDEAILCTDLERAEEVLNRSKTESAKGGTGRGIGPSYAHHYDKLGLKIHHLLSSSWEETLSTYYDWYTKLFSSFGMTLSKMEVPDYKETLKTGKAESRTVGTKQEFLKRLKVSRAWLIKKNIATNTFLFHKKIVDDLSTAILFEGAQAAGLDAWLGTIPDVTSSNTSVYGVREGTAFWRIQDIEKRHGVFKIPYTSSVGSRHLPTHITIPSEKQGSSLTKDQAWAAWIREDAHEYGTTTGRPRDITHLDLSMLTYNAYTSGVETLIGTHLDTSRIKDTIKVCTHYTDKNGNFVPYQPGLRHLENVIPNYIELPGWDGKICRKATKLTDLPKAALQFLSFIQLQTGFPIVAATTGPDRSNLITFEGY